MSDDIVARLRSWDHCWPARWLEGATAEAADEIERLRAELAAAERQNVEITNALMFDVKSAEAERDALRAELAAEKDRGNNWRAACQVQNERVEKATAERDKLRALLREARDYGKHPTRYLDMAFCARIDAALKTD